MVQKRLDDPDPTQVRLGAGSRTWHDHRGEIHLIGGLPFRERWRLKADPEGDNKEKKHRSTTKIPWASDSDSVTK